MTSPVYEPVTGLVAVLCVLVIFAFLLVGMAIEAGWAGHDETEPDAAAASPTPDREADDVPGQSVGHDDR